MTLTVITIGSSRIGLAAARPFHQHGAQLVLAAQDEAKRDAAAELYGGPVRLVNWRALPFASSGTRDTNVHHAPCTTLRSAGRLPWK
ncbi:hypothetical protein ABZ638_15660 [Streptomyces sp. NPDC007107]|uniref:hypothetical protein n=1 Tax=Streptomyces sp. NPDC007107 TaxID=3156915 RepID=UPI0033CFEC7B